MNRWPQASIERWIAEAGMKVRTELTFCKDHEFGKMVHVFANKL